MMTIINLAKIKKNNHMILSQLLPFENLDIGKNLKTNHMLIPELLHFSENLKFQSYVSNTPAALACSSIDNTAMLYVFCLVTQCTLKFKCFQKSKFIARNARAGNQKRDPPFRLTLLKPFVCIVD